MPDPKHPRRFTDELERQMVELYESGKPRREIEREHDPGKSTLGRWIDAYEASGTTSPAKARAPEQDRVIGLEHENRQLGMEVDVLEQAALIFARK